MDLTNEDLQGWANVGLGVVNAVRGDRNGAKPLTVAVAAKPPSPPWMKPALIIAVVLAVGFVLVSAFKGKKRSP